MGGDASRIARSGGRPAASRAAALAEAGKGAVKARGGCIIRVISEGDNELPRVVDHVITIPGAIDMLTPILASARPWVFFS